MKRKHFTLVEILVAIGIIVVLAAMLLGGVNVALSKGENAKAKSDIVTLRNAIAAFEMEYNKLPKPAGYSGGKITGNAYTWLLRTLQGEKLKSSTGETPSFDYTSYGNLNPKKKKFLDVQENEPGRMKDPWDNEYVIVFEKKHDKGIDYSKDNGKQKQNIPGIIVKNERIYQSVVIWSKGEDGDQNDTASDSSNKDNIYSVETNWKDGHGYEITK